MDCLTNEKYSFPGFFIVILNVYMVEIILLIFLLFSCTKQQQRANARITCSPTFITQSRSSRVIRLKTSIPAYFRKYFPSLFVPFVRDVKAGTGLRL